MAKTEFSTEQIKEGQGFAQADLRRLQKVRKNYGDERWAQAVADSLVSNMILAVQDRDISYLGDLNVIALRPLLDEIKADPKLSQKFMEGILDEMESRSFFGEPQLNK